MTLVHSALLLGTAVVAGALNSVAGGGSFITFPALVFSGVSPVVANATNSVAIWPACVASAFAYRHEMKEVRRPLVVLGAASLVGGLVGGLLLLWTSDATFMHLVPWLLLLATLLFTFGPRIAARVRSSPFHTPERATVATFAVQLVIATYGGYFGAGMGIMMLASLALLGISHIHTMNGVKTVLTAIINGVAVIAFVAAGAIAWAPALLMAAGATVGGFFGAFAARKLDPARVRSSIVVIAWIMTVYFFVKQYGRLLI